MASPFDRNLIADVRKTTGATNTNRVPRHVLEEEVTNAKEVISQEVREKLNNGETLAFGEGAGERALKNYLYLRVSDKVRSASGPVNAPSDVSSVPRSPSAIRRTDFGDSQLNYWRDQMVNAIRDI